MKSLESLAKKIEKENELFSTMTKEQKKVTIAKDCIARIKLEQLKPRKNSFMDYDFHDEAEYLGEKLGTDSLKTVVNSDKLPTCQVCAKGGLFLSYIGRANNFEICELSNDNDADGSEHQKLLEIFTMTELAYIEFAYEGKQYINADEKDEEIKFTDEEETKAQKFYKRYGGQFRGKIGDISFEAICSDYGSETDQVENRRLVAICKNIIKNNGNFTL